MGRAFEYRKARKMKRWGHMARVFTKIGKEIEMAVKASGPDPSSNLRLRLLIQNAKARQMIRQINTVSAQSLISNAMKEAGLEFQYEAQQYRAKISVKLTPNNKLVFYINYKKAAELLPGAIESARQAKELLAKLGNNASFKKCNGWEQWD
jgi:hypothetical protein